jgi:hypothetical protein
LHRFPGGFKAFGHVIAAKGRNLHNWRPERFGQLSRADQVRTLFAAFPQAGNDGGLMRPKLAKQVRIALGANSDDKLPGLYG